MTFTLALGTRLIARAEDDAFRRVLTLVLQHAIGRTANGSVLVTAGQHGGRLRVAISDDGPFGDETGTRAALHAASEFLASRSGSLEVDSRPGEGMTVSMRLPVVWAADRNATPFATPGTSAAAPA